MLVVLAPCIALISGAAPTDLLTPRASPDFLIPWALSIFGVAVRLWGSGNLRKNEEITRTGVYALLRHPLYLGSLSVFLAYFITIGDPFVGVILFALLVGGIYYPTMLSEEEYLGFKFPGQFATYRAPPRLVPDLSRLREAIRSDRFSARAAYKNLGFRSLWILLLLPLFLRLFAWIA